MSKRRVLTLVASLALALVTGLSLFPARADSPFDGSHKVKVISRDTGMCLTMEQEPGWSGNWPSIYLKMRPCDGRQGQVFKMEGSQKFVLSSSFDSTPDLSFCMTVWSAYSPWAFFGSKSGAVEMSGCKDFYTPFTLEWGPNAWQLWVYRADSGWTTNVYRNCLDVLGAKKNDGAPVGLWECNGAANQGWGIYYAE